MSRFILINNVLFLRNEIIRVSKQTSLLGKPLLVVDTYLNKRSMTILSFKKDDPKYHEAFEILDRVAFQNTKNL